jgi:hypothetical protein
MQLKKFIPQGALSNQIWRLRHCDKQNPIQFDCSARVWIRNEIPRRRALMFQGEVNERNLIKALAAVE